VNLSILDVVQSASIFVKQVAPIKAVLAPIDPTLSVVILNSFYFLSFNGLPKIIVNPVVTLIYNF